MLGIKYLPPNTPVCTIFFEFCYFLSDKTCFQRHWLATFTCLWKKTNSLHFYLLCVLCYFYWVGPINFLHATVIQFSIFCRSRLPSQLIVENLSNRLIIGLQHFDVFMIPIRPFTTIRLAIQNHVKFTLLYTRLSQHHVIWDTIEGFMFMNY